MPDLDITDSQDEQTLEEFFRDADQVHVPIFQRQYVWKQVQFDELCRDLRSIREGIEKSQFLGAVVSYERQRQHEVVGRLRSLAVVDGQQRILTLYIFVMCIVELLARLDADEALEIAQEFLLLAARRGLETNTRVVPAYPDRAQFRVLWDRINSIEVLGDKLAANPPQPPAPSGASVGDLEKQYRRIISYIRGLLAKVDNADAKIEYLRVLLSHITRHLTFVHLQLNDASSATKIFERLNFRGVKVGILDLVRNEVFSRVNDPAESQRIFQDIWRPFEEHFKGTAEEFFFPYCLTQNSNINKSEIFVQLRKTWGEKSPQEIIEHMLPYQGPYLAVDSGLAVPGSEELTRRLLRLRRARRPSVTYPFLMQLIRAYEAGVVEESVCVAIVDVIEVFLVRRAIAGYEPTGLHALFKGLWDEIGEVTPTNFATIVGSKATIQWPNDEEVRTAVRIRPIAKAKICGFLLQEYDRSLPGDVIEDEPTIEHVLPQSYDPDSEWAESFTKEEAKDLRDTLANVIPLSQPLNSSLQANWYGVKRARYLKESKFVTPRHLAESYAEWTPETIRARGEKLADWIVETWPNP